MKHQILLLFSLLILSSFFASAHLLIPQKGSKQGENELKIIGNTVAQSSTEMKEDTEELMGSEECYDEKDEEWSRRRMIAEAHLDYIYTQDHKP
ncbi:putative phytosulfokine [Trifolium repens]|nr:putative phytosulfokine [Trifolium repens]